MAHAHLAYYRALERDGYMRMLTTAAQLHEHVANLKSQPDKTPLGFILTMEGADPVLKQRRLTSSISMACGPSG